MRFENVPYRRWRYAKRGAPYLSFTREGARVLKRILAVSRAGGSVEFVQSEPRGAPRIDGDIYDTISATIED